MNLQFSVLDIGSTTRSNQIRSKVHPSALQLYQRLEFALGSHTETVQIRKLRKDEKLSRPVLRGYSTSHATIDLQNSLVNQNFIL